MTTFSKGLDRALVSVGGDEDGFHLYLPRGGTLSNIAAVLSAVAPRQQNDRFTPGESAADIVAAISPAVRCQLIPGAARMVRDFYQVADARVSLSYVPQKGFEVRTFNIQGGVAATEPMFAGTIQGFADWAQKLTGLEVALKKVVRFKYLGGSTPGAIRTVRVESVSRADDKVHILGVDLEKENLSDAHRRYSSDKIEGEISIVN